MEKKQKCLADQLYDEKKRNPGKRKNAGATGAAGSLTPYCVDGATLYCTMGSASSILRAADHGLRLTDRAAAHDGDTAPNKNIFPFGNCKLKDNKPCACPAPVGRWLLPDEYAVIGSCYAGKAELFQKAERLAQKARLALEPLHASVFLLESAKTPQMEPWLRGALYEAARSLREEKERMALISGRTFADAAEAADYLGELYRFAKSAKKAMDQIQESLSAPEMMKDLLRENLAGILQKPGGDHNAMGLKEHLEQYISGLSSDAISGLHRESRDLYLKNLAAIASHAEKAITAIQSLQEEAKSIEDADGADLGCQLTMNSVIPCQLGGLIHF